MRRIAFAARDSAEPFVFAEAAEPVPGPGQILVRTETVGVGVGLLRMLNAGSLPEGGPGGELVGIVTALGPGVEGYEVGDRVGGVVFEGAYAEYALASPLLVSAVPTGVDAADALALVRGGLVGLSALRAGRFEKGESVLVTAAASGVGHLLVQLAKTFGASRVVAAVGTADKADFLRSLGADEVVTYAQECWGEPVDLVLDGVGGEMVQKGVDALGPYGRLVAFSAGGGSVDVGGMLGQLKSVIGFAIGLLSRQRPELIAERRAELWELLREGRLRPACTALPWNEIGEAVALVESRRNLGRVLLRTGYLAP